MTTDSYRRYVNPDIVRLPAALDSVLAARPSDGVAAKIAKRKSVLEGSH
jgi:hypothetical protein